MNTSGLETAEVLRLVVILLAATPFLVLAGRLRQRGGLLLLYGAFFAIAASHVFAVVEDLTTVEPVLDMIQHLFYGVAGVLAAAGAIAMWWSKRERRAET